MKIEKCKLQIARYTELLCATGSSNLQFVFFNSQSPTPVRRPPANLVPIDPIPAVDFRSGGAPRAGPGRPLRLRWEGDQFIRSSLALVNRELCLQLIARDGQRRRDGK